MDIPRFTFMAFTMSLCWLVINVLDFFFGALSSYDGYALIVSTVIAVVLYASGRRSESKSKCSM
jgi:hypothetical protein